MNCGETLTDCLSYYLYKLYHSDVKARIFLLVDLREKKFGYRVEDKKKQQQNLKMTS